MTTTEYETVSTASRPGIHIHVLGARLTLCGLTPQERLGRPISEADCRTCQISEAYKEATR